MAGENSENLYRALNEVDPSRAPEIVHKYKTIMEGIDQALVYGDEKMAQEARDHLEIIADDLIYQQQRADLIEPFEQELDTIAESLGIAISVPTTVEVSDERPVGFAERYRESELREIFDSYSAQEWQGIIDTMLEEGAEALQIPKERQYRVEQLNAIIIALEGIKKKIEESKGVGEDLNQLFEFEGNTKHRARKISNLIDPLKKTGMIEIVQNGLSVEELFLKHNDLFGDEVRSVLRSYSETQAFLDQYGNMIDVTDETKKKEYYLALVKFLRDRSDYQTAQSILEEVLSYEFQHAINFIPGDPEGSDTSESNVKGRLYDQADAKIGKLVTDNVITQWRKDGMTREQIEDSKRNLRDMHYERLLHQYAAEHILVGDLHSAGEGLHIAPLDGNEAFWEQYNDMLDPKEEFFNLTDDSWDMILEELVYTAPLIIVSGGVAGAVAKGLSYGARAALAATRMATWGARLARGGRMARTALRLGRLSAQGTSLLVEGAIFELTFQGIQGELIFAQEDWVKQILWTSAALGLFKGAGKLGGKGAEALNTAIAKVAPKLNGNLVQLINKLVIIGHTQVAAMLLLGAVQHMAAGEFEEFWNNFGYQIFHAYVAVGSLNLAHGVISTAKGRVFRPKVEKPKGEGAQEKPGRVAEASPQKKLPVAARIAEAISARQSQSIEVSRGRDLSSAVETLASKGFTLEPVENGGIIARKGGVEIFLKPTGKLRGAIKGISAKLSEFNAILERNGGRIDKKTVNELVAAMETSISDLTRSGLPRRLAVAVSLVMLSGCESLQKLGGGAAGLVEAIPAILATLGIGYGSGVIIHAILKGRTGWKSGKAEAKAWETLEIAEPAAPGAGAAALATRLSTLSRELKTLKNKVKGGDYAEVRVQLGLFDTSIGKLITELRRPAGARQAQIDTHLQSAREALANLTQPESPLWSAPSLIRMATGLAAIVAALYVMNGAGYFGDGGNDEEEDIEEIPIGPGGGGGTVDEGEVIEEAPQGGGTVAPTPTPSAAPDAGSAPQGGTSPAPTPSPSPTPAPKQGEIEFYE